MPGRQTSGKASEPASLEADRACILCWNSRSRQALPDSFTCCVQVDLHDMVAEMVRCMDSGLLLQSEQRLSAVHACCCMAAAKGGCCIPNSEKGGSLSWPAESGSQAVRNAAFRAGAELLTPMAWPGLL